MCGIAGFVGSGDEPVLRRMMEAIAHRGPDDCGLYSSAMPIPVGLTNTRLAIQDLSPAGHQPMQSADGRMICVFNGEIYNFPELRAQLVAQGERFISHSDTEVVLRLFVREGPQMLRRLNGMFALAIWDSDAHSLFLARDRFGEKPMYVYRKAGTLLFGSEVKALAQHPSFSAELEERYLPQFLTFLWVPEPGSLFKCVHKLPASHYAIWRDGQYTETEYWDLAPPEVPIRASVEEIAAEVRRQLIASVRRRLVSDRPVGAFLSGGVDSATILAAMAQTTSEPIRAYTIGFPDRDYLYESVESEVPRAKAVAARVGATWEHIELDAKVTDLLPTVVWHLDEPIGDPAAITAYLLCKTAKASRTVLLSGMGGDEVFAGYRRHMAFHLTAMYRRLPAWVRAAAAATPGMLGLVKDGRIAGLARDLHAFTRDASEPFEKRFVGYARYYRDDELSALLSPRMREMMAGENVERTHLHHLMRHPNATPLSRMLYADMKTFMVSLNMLYMDKMSMASAVEGRLPFLDHDLVEFAARIPDHLKIRGLTVKWILREAFDKDLPKEVLWSRRKVGFGAPLRTWLERDLKPIVADLLSEDRIRRRGLFDPAAVRRIVDRPLAGRNHFRIWALMTFELWMQRFIDRN